MPSRPELKEAIACCWADSLTHAVVLLRFLKFKIKAKVKMQQMKLCSSALTFISRSHLVSASLFGVRVSVICVECL